VRKNELVKSTHERGMLAADLIRKVKGGMAIASFPDILHHRIRFPAGWNFPAGPQRCPPLKRLFAEQERAQPDQEAYFEKRSHSPGNDPVDRALEQAVADRVA
jgi:hypothetical protein